MEPVRERRWRLREYDQAAVERLTRECSMDSLTARLLVARVTSEPAAAERFLSSLLSDIHNPFLLLGMEAAVTRLVLAVNRGETVCVYGDYDVDGVASVSLLVSFFRAIELSCFYHIPNRMDDGYGLSCDGLAAAASRGATVVISVDCGISAVAEARSAAELGLDLIITDHHTPGDEIPAACAVINPHQPGCAFPFKLLAGVGVAFNLLIALRSRLREAGYFVRRDEPDLKQFLDLVALGTVADIVPLLDENRIFVKYGLRQLTAGGRIGIEELKRVAGITGEVTCATVGFRLAPRLNAAGRLDDAAPGVELLLCADPQRARLLAEELDASNAERQEVERQILRDAVEQVRCSYTADYQYSIVLASQAWHPGVIGIVASRLVDLFHRPTVLIAIQDGNGRGSGRSIPAFHLYDALNSCADQLQQFGGHKYAAGLSISQDALVPFRDRFEALARRDLLPEDLVPELVVDAELTHAQLTQGLVEQLARLEPYGMGNPTPLFLLRGVRATEVRTVKERHLKFKALLMGGEWDVIGFDMAGTPMSGKLFDLVVTLHLDIWRDGKRLQLRLKDLREAV